MLCHIQQPFESTSGAFVVIRASSHHILHGLLNEAVDGSDWNPSLTPDKSDFVALRTRNVGSLTDEDQRLAKVRRKVEGAIESANKLRTYVPKFIIGAKLTAGECLMSRGKMLHEM